MQDFKDEQPENAPEPTNSTLSGITISDREEQPANALLPIDIIP